MSTLRLDYQNQSPIPWAGFALLGVVMLATILTVNYYITLSDRSTVWEAKLAKIQNKEALLGSAKRSTEQGSAELAQEVSNANEVLRQLSVPWNTFFHSIESSGSSKVTLLALEPDVEKRQVKISGEANNYGALMKYITQLEKQPIFFSVYLQTHHVQQQDPDRPVRFTLIATWQETP